MADPYYSYTGGPAPLPGYRNPPGSLTRAPMPPPRPNDLGVTAPVVAQPEGPMPPAQGGGSVWDALLTLFSGQQNNPSGQGMSGMLTPRGSGGMGTDMLGNPTNRFG